MFSRRWILRFMFAVGFLLTIRKRSAMAQLVFRPKKKSKPRAPENLFTENGKAVVGVSGNGSPAEMIRSAVALIGGFDKLKIKGKTVLVKPNVVSGEKNPATTNPEVVGAMVKILYEEGAKKVYVGDMSAMMILSTKRNMSANGIRRAAEASGAEVVGFEDHAWGGG